MELKKIITPFQLDVLKEIGNIGAGNAATALSVLVGKNIDMKVPSVRIVTFDEMLEMAGGHDTIVTAVFLRVEGDASGSMFFILPIEQATKYVQKLTGDMSFSFENPPYSEMGLSAMQELGNILSGSYLSSLSDFTGLDLYPSVPSISVDMAGAIISYGLIELSHSQDYAIVIDTALNEENTNSVSVNGHFFLLPDPNSFSVIFNTLGVEMND
ncbi:chemotaxis protein CheC [Bacillus sp. FJAT-49711]|uniref:chemotaxis protein CheC n=1 Tax=Bacillus sp. FJAT-49711 TaxID=2833585 RepID=UPI001BC98699|nr:chemotaxis protein CheC [Bacillus sp. FJAT-49711]MBS4217728.1 chemotaxis protein CheC [Bacillus sp. FJAT-49711]